MCVILHPYFHNKNDEKIIHNSSYTFCYGYINICSVTY